jgi:hypothetical protein
VFTLAQARERLADLRPRIDSLIVLRANLAELRADLEAGRPSRHGRLAEAKGWEAELFAELERFAAAGAQVKGVAPLLLDWPGKYGGEQVLWCWLEGDPDIGWYHRADCGFMGRRRL